MDSLNFNSTVYTSKSGNTFTDKILCEISDANFDFSEMQKKLQTIVESSLEKRDCWYRCQNEEDYFLLTRFFSYYYAPRIYNRRPHRLALVFGKFEGSDWYRFADDEIIETGEEVYGTVSLKELEANPKKLSFYYDGDIESLKRKLS